jgi:lysophospholipase L1-like esterase
MVFGDSNAFRPGGGHTCWPALLEDKDSDHLNVFNESCKGRTTQYDTGERNGLGVIRDKLAAYTPLDYVIVMLGTNDVKSQYGPPRAADIADGPWVMSPPVSWPAHSRGFLPSQSHTAF